MIKDFYYLEPDREIYVFVDGPPHTPEPVQQQDREKRDILESKGYTVIDLDFKDGRYIEDSSLIRREVLKLRDYFDDVIEYEFQSKGVDSKEVVTKEQIIKEPIEISDKTTATNRLISEFESKIREFIKNQLEKSFGEDWWNQGIPQNIREMAETRKSNKQKVEPKRLYNTIDFLNFWDYNNIILYKKNWNNIFKEFFREKYVVQAPFEKISNIRNDIAHNRFMEEDYERCKTYIEDILKYLPEV